LGHLLGCNAVQCKSLPKYPLTDNSPLFVTVNSNVTTLNVSFADTTCIVCNMFFAVNLTLF
jgi:hypothetical protein